MLTIWGKKHMKYEYEFICAGLQTNKKLQTVNKKIMSNKNCSVVICTSKHAGGAGTQGMETF